MAFNVPTFPIKVNIWRSSTLLTNPPDVVTFGQLRLLKTAFLSVFGVNPGPMLLLLPKLTDIRDGRMTNGPDTVEAPAASGRFYTVGTVDDVAKGFPNEYRAASIRDLPGRPTPLP